MYHEPYKNNQPQRGAEHEQYYPDQSQAYANAPPVLGYPTQQQQYYNHNHAQEVNAIKPENPSNGGMCRDWPFAILFIVNILAIGVCLFMWGLDAVKVGSEDNTSFMSANDKRNCVLLACGFSAIAVVLSLAFVKLIVAYARCMINFTLWFNVGVAFAIAVYGFGTGNYVLGIIGGVLALLTFCYARAVQHRIPFAVANLRVAEAAISKHWSTYIVSFAFTLIQIGWVVAWCIAFLGVANHLKETQDMNQNGLPSGASCITNSDCSSLRCTYINQIKQCSGSSSSGFQSSGTGYAAYFFLVLSFYWGLQVFKNVPHTTNAGTVATFWYNAESSGATGSSLKRSMTTSFGSICFGSLLVAIIQALRAMAEQARSEGSFAACIADCILGCLQSIMEYINRWAFVYVGIYGYKFTQAGKAVFNLFAQRGFDMIINDDLIGNVLSFASLAVGLVCAGVGAIIAQSTTFVNFDHANIALPILGLLIGVGVAITPLSVIDSSVATIFVCFAEDPVAFQQSHPDLYQPLVTEWHNLYPEIMAQAGYWRS